MTLRIDEIAYHRNGISGAGFHAVLFCKRYGRHWRKFFAAVFEEPGNVAVICLDLVTEHGVNKFKNAWRGDTFEHDLREAIEAAGK